jgi:hypothetical protein
MILKAAILQKDSRIVYVGRRHGDCFKVMQNSGVRYQNCVQGFVDAEGNFLDRREAYKHALVCNQINQKKDSDSEFCKQYNLNPTDHILTSEDLY